MGKMRMCRRICKCVNVTVRVSLGLGLGCHVRILPMIESTGYIFHSTIFVTTGSWCDIARNRVGTIIGRKKELLCLHHFSHKLHILRKAPLYCSGR